MNHALLKQSTLYLLVGGTVYVIDLGIFTAIVLIWPSELVLGNAVGKLIGAAIGFVLHKYVTFAGMQHHSSLRQVVAYVALLFGNIVVGSILIYGLVDMFGFPKIPSRMAVDVFVVVSAFFVSRNQIFRHVGLMPMHKLSSSQKSLTP